MNIYNGLSDKEVIINREKYGKNIFTKRKKDSFFKLLLETFNDPIIKILLIALGIKVVFLFRNFDWYETLGIVIAILIASLISSISEYGSMRAFSKLTEDSSKIYVRVIRNGIVKRINIEDIVIDDIVVLSTGDRIPADGIIIKGLLAVDESIINGESKESYKDVNSDNINLYRGCVIYSGEGLMRVKKIGDNTFYGTMVYELQDDNNISPLKIRLTKLAKSISTIGYICSFIALISYLFYMIIISNNFDKHLILNTLSNTKIMFEYILNGLTLCVTIIVVSVPEGLPMMITLVLSSNMKRMLKDNVLVRKLVGIETAGNINVLFTDKTGTLTEGKLSISGFLSGYGESIDYNLINKSYQELFNMSMYMNNESSYDIDNNKIIGGNITDRAIYEYVKSLKMNYDLIDRDIFDSKKKYMRSKIIYKNKKYNLVKGAYEVLGNLCNSYYDKDGQKHLFKDRDFLDKIITNISRNKLRVICLCINEERDTIKNMSLIGFIILKDTIRDKVKEGIDLVNRASIQTIMITGDNKDTAISVAKEIGLITKESDIVITSDNLDKMKDIDIIKIFHNIKVVARAMPQDKSRLVNIAKQMNLVVGMTGDGVNDALALKKADVGFSMGSGTEVAKEASDIVILDDNFYSITNAILYGRTIFKSIRKFIICQLTINLCSLLISIIGPFIGIPVPITVIQMLWINMIMDTLSGFAFSYEPSLKEYMEEPSLNKDEFIINKYMINQILITGITSSLLCIIFLKSNLIISIFGNNIMTAFFGLIIFISIFNSFNARTHRLNILANITKNKVFIGVIIFVFLMQIILLYYGGTMFRTNGLSIEEFIIMFLYSLLIIPIDFIRKLYLKKKGYKLGV